MIGRLVIPLLLLASGAITQSAPHGGPLPGAGYSPLLARLWEEGALLERQGDLAAAARIYEGIARLWPIDAYTYWRIAESYWNLAQTLPDTRRGERDRYVRLTEEWAERGLAIDPECGECCLYKVAGLGGRLREEGKLAAAGKAKEIAALLERGIAILSARPDHRTNPELEELYYAAAQFYRTMPEWAWLKLFLGVRGSRRRAHEYMREANAIATAIDGERPANLVELSAALLCVGRDENAPALTAEGNETLTRVVASEALRAKDPASARRAEALLAHPEGACGYSSDER